MLSLSLDYSCLSTNVLGSLLNYQLQWYYSLFPQLNAGIQDYRILLVTKKVTIYLPFVFKYFSFLVTSNVTKWLRRMEDGQWRGEKNPRTTVKFFFLSWFSVSHKWQMKNLHVCGCLLLSLLVLLSQLVGQINIYAPEMYFTKIKLLIQSWKGTFKLQDEHINISTTKTTET